MNNNIELLSNIAVYNKYAKYIPSLKRRETWEEIVDRYLVMMFKRYATEQDKTILKDMVDKHFVRTGEQLQLRDISTNELDYFSNLSGQLIKNSEHLYNKSVLPSMRAVQFAGAAIEKNEARIYNCGYMPMEDYRAFGELMFLLLGGTGLGYSVQYHHVEKLPEIQKPLKEAKYLVGDSIEGWADAVKQLMKAYFGLTKVKPRFDYSDIREKGAALITAGGKAPGPEPLRIALTKIEALLNSKKDGEKLTDFEVHRICCLIADAVLAGGIRRAALIALFSFDSKIMATCKHGTWWEKYPELGRANNSAVILRNRVKREEFDSLWAMIVDSNSGEPGVYFTNDPEYGTNPCCEIALRPYTFCNLTEINAGVDYQAWADKYIHPDDRNPKEYKEVKQHLLEQQVKVAAFFGTLQAGFTDFHYLRNVWKKNTEKDALIGVGMTGIANGSITEEMLSNVAEVAKQENERVATLIGINKAARVTTVKPSGTTSCVVGTSSGIHAWHSKYYIRNMQCRVGDDLYNFFTEHHPKLIKVMDYDPDSAVIGIPQMAPEGAIMREDETALELLERVKGFNLEWVKKGHRRGPNTNNVSATISVKDTEWKDVGNWMWKYRDTYNGLSVLPYDGGSYKDAPFIEIDKAQYEELTKYIEENPINLTKIREDVDNTDLTGEVACAGGACEVI
jgi:ribonucleoside-triphosphate reductase (thioredoxin)